MNRPPRPLALLASLALFAQSTGAAALPAALNRLPAAFPPPAARFAALPPGRAAAAPSAPRASGPGRFESWLESAKVVVSALIEAASAPAPEAAKAAPVPGNGPERALNPIAAVPAPAAPAAPPADRMLVVMDPGVRVEAVLGRGGDDFSARPGALRSGPFPSLPDFRGPWIEANGLRARLSYLAPHGKVTGGADGYRAIFADGGERFAPVAGGLPAPYRRAYPIFFHGERVEMAVTVVNRGDRALKNVRVSAVQETFRPVGTEGMRLAPPTVLAVAAELAPGASATARWSAVLTGPGSAAVNLEQTHLTVTSGDGPSEATLLDAPQAGVVDPPGPGLL